MIVIFEGNKRYMQKVSPAPRKYTSGMSPICPHYPKRDITMKLI